MGIKTGHVASYKHVPDCSTSCKLHHNISRVSDLSRLACLLWKRGHPCSVPFADGQAARALTDHEKAAIAQAGSASKMLRHGESTAWHWLQVSLMCAAGFGSVQTNSMAFQLFWEALQCLQSSPCTHHCPDLTQRKIKKPMTTCSSAARTRRKVKLNHLVFP